jgi:hypothetical protein
VAIRHVEGRLLDRLEGLDDQGGEPERKNRSADRKQENAIERQGQTLKTKTQKPAATTSAKHFTRQMRK